MALVTIAQDETYGYIISQVVDPERCWYPPVEIPDDLLADYKAAQLHEYEIRRYIIETYGTSYPEDD